MYLAKPIRGGEVKCGAEGGLADWVVDLKSGW